MLTITPAQLDALTREHLLDRVRRFLLAHSSDAGLSALLASPEGCRAFWLPWYERFGGGDEHGLAVRLCYMLASRVHDLDPRLVDVAGEEGEIAMKWLLEERAILPFIAFDQG